MSVIRLLTILLTVNGLFGCATATTPVTGFLYSNVKGPFTANNMADFNVNKVGRSTAKSILGLYASGDASIHSAAKNGGITKIHHVDYETRTLFGLIAEFTIVVYGE
jgi:hypothetical protein